MKRVFVGLLVVPMLVAILSHEMVYAADRNGSNKNRNLLIATSALGGTLAGAVLGIFADRAFLVNSPSADKSGQPVSYSPAVYQQPAPSYAPASNNSGYQTGAFTPDPCT